MFGSYFRTLAVILVSDFQAQDHMHSHILIYSYTLNVVYSLDILMIVYKLSDTF